MIAPDLADKVIPNLTADTGFDRGAFNQLVQAFMGLSDADGGPTFETLPWERGNSAGSYLELKQPEADAVLAVLRGQAPIPTTTTAPADSGSGSGTTAPAVRAVRRAGARCSTAPGVQNAAGNTSQALTGEGFVAGGAENEPRGTIDKTEIRYASSDLAKAQLLADVRARRATLVPDSSLSGTDVVLVLGKNF